MSQQINKYDEIRKDEATRKKDIEKQITNIELRQQELQNYISLIDQGIQQLDAMIINEQRQSQPDYNKINAWRGALAKNIELSSKVYSTYREYEDIKFKCRKEINESAYKTNHLLHVAIRQVDERVDKMTDNDFVNMLTTLTDMMRNSKGTANEKFEPLLNESKRELLTDKEYDI